MVPFSPETFFDITHFAHPSLFTPHRLVWEVLAHLEPFLSHFPRFKNQENYPLIEGEIEEGAYLINKETILIGKGSHVEAGAYIRGPVIIGENCHIRHGAYLRGNIVLGNGVVIGHASELKNAIFLDKSAAPHFAYVGDSIIGNGVNLGAGTKCANLRIDRRPISIKTKEERIATGLRKLGAIIGDGAQIGCNCVLNPGTLIGKRARSYPGVVLEGYISDDALIKGNDYVACT